MKRLAWLLAAALLFAFAHAEFESELVTDAKGSAGIRISFFNDTGKTVSGMRLYCDDRLLSEIAGSVRAGEVYSNTFSIALTDEMRANGSITVRLFYDGGGSTCTVPVSYPGAKLYIRLPGRAVRDGETVMVSYVLSNEGEYDIKNARIQSSTGYESPFFSLKAGEVVEFEDALAVAFPMSLTAEVLVSKMVIANTAEISPDQLEENVKITCIADSSAQAGSGTRVTVNIENLGNTDYYDPVLTEKTFGRMSGLPALIKAGSFTTVNITTPALSADTDLEFTLTGRAEDGTLTTFDAGKAHISVSGSVPAFEGAKLASDPKGEPSFEVNALLWLTTLKGLPVVVLYVCAGASALFLAVMLIKNARRRKKR